MNTGTVPLAWKESNVTPVYKGEDTENPGNFCPISVVPVVAKVLEKKMVADQLSLFWRVIICLMIFRVLIVIADL